MITRKILLSNQLIVGNDYPVMGIPDPSCPGNIIRGLFGGDAIIGHSTGSMSAPPSAAPAPAPEESQDHLVHWFRSRRRPLLLLGLPDLKVLACNDAASALLSDGPDLRIHQDRLAFCDPATRERFQAHLELCPGEVTPWLLQQRDSDRYIILEIDRLPTETATRAVMVAIHFSDGDPTARWSDFGTVFGLTPAEERIARMLTGGDGVEEIAADAAITVETARTHIRRIYNKVGVGSREHLTAVLLPFRLG